MNIINKKFYIFAFFAILCGACQAGQSVDDTLLSIKSGDVRGIETGLRGGLDVNFADEVGNTLLMLAARSGYPDSVALLLNAGAKVYSRNTFGDTAVLLATFSGNEKIVDLLLSHGASIEANPKGWTPLHYAAFAGHPALVEKFIKLGTNIDSPTNNGLTPLMVASMNGHIAVVKILLLHHANIQLRDENGKTAIAHALAHKNTDIAMLLNEAQVKR